MINIGPTIQTQPAKSERRDAAENRQLILATARKLFAEQGVAAVCMSDIAKEACVGKGTLYRRFSNKGRLCLALLDDELREFQNKVIQNFQEQTTNQIPIYEQLLWFVEQAVNFTSIHLPLMVEISAAGSEGAVQDVNQPHFWFEMTLKGHLLQLQNSQLISPEENLDYIASAILAPLDARIMKHHLETRGFTTKQITHGIQTLIRGLMN
ncbi:MAG: TetR/AcrR family transcriptional regulator [Chloroflexota bacterium]